MNTTQAQQKALDDALEPTLQVVLDDLKLTPFFKAFEITTDVPEIYMQEICPKLIGQKFEDPPFEEEILSFIRDLGHTGEIKVLTDINVNHMHQPWISFAVIINKCPYPSNPRRNKMFWHTTRDESMFTIIRVISKHQDTQIYGPILPRHLTNQDMIESEAVKTYYAHATGEKTQKPKYVKKKADSNTTPKKKIRYCIFI
ncbi:hypothetical protein Tco_0870774 [Tanacetum coccineum]